jgi:hypothetical protein
MRGIRMTFYPSNKDTRPRQLSAAFVGEIRACLDLDWGLLVAIPRRISQLRWITPEDAEQIANYHDQ